MLTINKSPTLNLDVITPNTIFEDFRGKYTELYNKQRYSEAGLTMDFVQDDYSFSRHNVLRGVHGDHKTWKLISCLFGSFFLIVVDNRSDSKTYKKWEYFSLSEENRTQVLVPPGFGNGHYVMSQNGTIFHYKQTTYYDRASQFTISWNDPTYNMFWPCSDPITSERDI